MSETAEVTLKTPLNAAHRALVARMVPFAGYDMPVQYEGVLAEHRWTREHAGLFDVSHMGQAKLRGAAPIKSIEKLVPGDYQGLKPGKQRYSLLLNKDGGILDDLTTGRFWPSRGRRPRWSWPSMTPSWPSSASWSACARPCSASTASSRVRAT